MNYPPLSRRGVGRSVFKRHQTGNCPCKVQCDCKLNAAFQMAVSPKLNAVLPLFLHHSGENSEELHFVHDRARLNFAAPVRSWLQNQFTCRWIGRGGPTEWSSRSSVIASCDLLSVVFGQTGSLPITVKNM